MSVKICNNPECTSIQYSGVLDSCPRCGTLFNSKPCFDVDCSDAGEMHIHPTLRDRIAKAIREEGSPEAAADRITNLIEEENSRPRFRCANDSCPSPVLEYNAYTLSGGYGSTILDCEPDLTFCSLQCIREWITTGWAKDITQ